MIFILHYGIIIKNNMPDNFGKTVLNMRFKGYKFTFKINATHKTHEKGSSHSHTFEFSVYIGQTNSFVQFNDIEQIINDELMQYANKNLNDTPPFDRINPTIENLAREFFAIISKSCLENGYKLYQIDASESSNRIFSIKDYEMSKQKKQTIINAAKSLDYNKFNSKKTIENKKKFQITDEPQSEQISPNKKVAVLKNTPPPEKKTVSNKVFWFSFLLLVIGGFITMMGVKLSGYYPLGFDIHGHLFKSDIMYESLKEGNIYPLFTEYWYNGLQPYRYWPPMPYYLFALLQFIVGGNVMNAYLGFIWVSFVVGGTGWLLFGRKLNRPVLSLLMAFLWFFLPDNLRVFFGEGNVPRMFITMIIPLIFYFIWQFVAYQRKKMIFPIIILMVIAATGHLMISAMIGVGTFIFLLIYSIVNKKYSESIYCILAMLFAFVVAGLWVYPSLVGGITSMETEGTKALMASLNAKLSLSLNPWLRLEGKVTELYLGLSIAIIALLGVFLSNRKALPGFASMIIVIVGTTTAVVPILEIIPFSQLFWIRRFAPIGYALFVIGILEWKHLKKPLLILLCTLLTLDCIPSINLKAYDEKMNIPATSKDIEQSMNDYLFTQAKQVAKQRICIMDLSTLGPMPSYALSSLEPKTQYVFGWAWQGASTASNIVRLNEALENYNYTYIFDRCIEMGADAIIFDKGHIPQEQYDNMQQSAKNIGYELVDESKNCLLYSLNVNGTFGVVTKYSGLAIGTSSSLIPQLFPYFGTGDYNYIDDYTFEELVAYDKLYLTGFFYKNKKNAEDLITKLADNGVEIFIDMNNIPADPLTTRMTFLGVSAQPITFNNKFPKIFYNNSEISTENFVEEHTEWNTVYLNNVTHSLGYAWFENEQLDFIGKKDNDNITFVGFNLLYHALIAKDNNVVNFLNDALGNSNNNFPQRNLVDIKVTYGDNQIIIESPQDNVNTTIAYQDNFVSDSEIKNSNNLLIVNKGVTVIDIKYPYLAKGLIVSALGITLESLIVFLIFRKRKSKDHTYQPKS